MTQYHYRFEHILTYQEQKKNETEADYKGAVDQFEQVATRLYELLKKKEQLIADYENKLAAGFSIEQIKLTTQYLEKLERLIAEVQQQVIDHRARMNWYEEKLLEDTIEVKKYQKMREKDVELFLEEEQHKEALFLDEISTQQYTRNRGGN